MSQFSHVKNSFNAVMVYSHRLSVELEHELGPALGRKDLCRTFQTASEQAQRPEQVQRKWVTFFRS